MTDISVDFSILNPIITIGKRDFWVTDKGNAAYQYIIEQGYTLRLRSANNKPGVYISDRYYLHLVEPQGTVVYRRYITAPECDHHYLSKLIIDCAIDVQVEQVREYLQEELLR